MFALTPSQVSLIIDWDTQSGWYSLGVQMNAGKANVVMKLSRLSAKTAQAPIKVSPAVIASKPPRNGHVSSTLSLPRAPTPKSKPPPTPPAVPAPSPTSIPAPNSVSKPSGAVMSSTDDSDDHQSANPASNPSFDGEGVREHDAMDPDTPQLTSSLPSASRASSMHSRPSMADHTPRGLLEYHPYRMAGFLGRRCSPSFD